VLLQHPNDLLFREPRSLHLSVLFQGRTLNPRGGKSQWQVTASADFFGCRVRFWIPHADVSSKGGNFATVNDVVRALRLKVRKSSARWAAYCAEAN
jgi:hypothetical protein